MARSRHDASRRTTHPGPDDLGATTPGAGPAPWAEPPLPASTAAPAARCRAGARGAGVQPRHAAVIDHDAVLYDGAAALPGAVVPRLRAALDEGAAVLTCVSPPRWASIASALGPRAGDVAFVPAGERYRRPVDAVAVLDRFCRDSLDRGDARIYSFGEIGFGSDDDADWFRYEVAVDDVFSGYPLAAVCLLDTTTLPPATLDTLHRLHGPDRAESRPAIAAPSLAPAEAPTAVLDATASIAAARRFVRNVAGGHLSTDRLAELELIVTELVTNAQRHGRPPIELAAWLRNAGAVVTVSDCGDGMQDPFADLRPPKGGTGGYGLWLAGQLATRLAVARSDGKTTVTAVVVR